MANDDDFLPRLGRSGKDRMRRPARYLSRILAATNLARSSVGSAKGKGFAGTRFGRGSGAGRSLSHFGIARQRRVIIKSRIVRLGARGLAQAGAHLKYIQRDGVTREGAPGAPYDARADEADGRAFLERGTGDRHQFRFIVSPEDGQDYDDLKSLTRRLMKQMEVDLGTRLDWVAVDHFNTGHPHTHIMLRGVDERGEDLRIAREYLSHGMRARAAELVEIDLGPPTERAAMDRLRAEVEQERLTSLDRSLLRRADADHIVSAGGATSFEQSCAAGRLAKLERLGLATRLDAGRFELAPDLANTLTRMGERGDIIRTMQRAYAAHDYAPAPADQLIYDPGPGTMPLVGRIAQRGLADELRDRHYLIVEAADGRSHYVAIGRGDALEPLPTGAVVQINPVLPQALAADHTVAAVAAANKGRYSIDAHLAYDPTATQDFAETHVRRLEAIRRLTKGVERLADGSWAIAPDHIDRALAYETARAADAPVTVSVLARTPVEMQARIEAPTWLDRELAADRPASTGDRGFGRDVRTAMAVRRQWLIEQGYGQAAEPRLSAAVLRDLQRRELLRLAATVESESGKAFVPLEGGEAITGKLARIIPTESGRLALIERAHDFSLVPWRPVLDRHIGQNVSGIVRGDNISWTIGRGRIGPTIS